MTHYRRSIAPTVKIGTLFGGFANQFGWLFFGFGLLFVWLFAASANVGFIYDWLDQKAVGIGVVTAIEPTRGKVNDIPVMANRFEFEAADRRIYQGLSFSTGQQVREGEEIIVEYPAQHPQYALIQGQRRSQFGLWIIALTALFPAIGAAFLIRGLRIGLHQLQLLREGIPGQGRLIAKHPTATRINKKTVYGLVFEYSDEQGRRQTTFTRSHKPHRLEDQHRERLLYRPGRPGDAVLLDSLPVVVSVKDTEVRMVRGGLAVRFLVVPVLAMVLNTVVFLAIHG